MWNIFVTSGEDKDRFFINMDSWFFILLNDIEFIKPIFNLMFNYHIWPEETPKTEFHIFLTYPPLFFECFFIFWHNKIFQICFLLSFPKL